jgi:hypothetical protein
MKIAFIRDNTIVNVAEFDSEFLDMSIFLNDNNADYYILEGDERISDRNMSVGASFNEERQAFIKDKPYASWVLDENNYWVAPIAKPGPGYNWDEDAVSWVQLQPIGSGE